MQEADLTEGSLHYKFGGLIFTVCAMICLLKINAIANLHEWKFQSISSKLIKLVGGPRTRTWALLHRCYLQTYKFEFYV